MTDATRQQAGPNGRRRLVIGALLLLVITIGYVDRINVSVAGPLVKDDLGLSNAQLGILYSAFFWGYAALMVPGGWLIDRVGKHFVLPLAVLCWSVVAALSSVAQSLGVLLGFRVVLGAAESPAYPSGNLIIREWAPLTERGLFTSLMQIGSLVGPALATAPAAWLATTVGWRWSFVLLAGTGLVWLVAWLLLYRPPERARWITERERAYILAARDHAVPVERADAAVRPMSVRTLIRQRPMLGILAANGAQTYVTYFLLTWLPTYLVTAKHLELPKSGLITSAMYGIAIVGAVVLGWLSDRFLSLSKDQALRGRRRYVVGVLMLAGLLPLVLTTWIEGLAALVITIAVTLMAVTTAITLTFALTNDLIIDNTSSGRTFGLVSFGGQVIGLLAPIVTGFVVQASGFGPVFLVTGAVLLAGVLAMLTLPNRPLQPRSSERPVAVG
ncbi:MAG TPA: MFS transporter [Pseudonocardia sp.]|jgi:MFS family permease|nr:MFS transporter [Pseudonocardia sp.]